MPNQLSSTKQRVTVAIPKHLVKKIDELALAARRSRTQIVEFLIEAELEHLQSTKKDDDAPKEKIKILSTKLF